MTDVGGLIAQLPPPTREIMERLRGVVRKAVPHAVESVKWGSPNYSIGGRNVAALHAYRDHVNLVFFRGAALRSRLLEGTGKEMGHIKVRSSGGIDEEEFVRLLREAARLA